MATLDVTFSFTTNPTTDSPAWSSSSGAATTMSWDSAFGNLAVGSLKARTAGRNKADSNYWLLQCTWQQLGIPANSTVTAISLKSTATRCTEYNVGSSSTIGPYTLRDSAGTLQATMWTGRTVTAVDGAWVATGQQATQSVPSALQPASSTIQIRLEDSLATGANNGAAVTTYDDDVVLTIAYTPPVDGVATLTQSQTMTATGTSGTFVNGTATLSQSQSLSATGSLTIPGSATLTQSATQTATGSLTIPGSATLTQTQVMTASGAAVIVGTATLQASSSLATTGGTLTLGSATLQVTSSMVASGVVPNSPGKLSVSSGPSTNRQVVHSADSSGVEVASSSTAGLTATHSSAGGAEVTSSGQATISKG